jgi:hypothetical protein
MPRPLKPAIAPALFLLFGCSDGGGDSGKVGSCEMSYFPLRWESGSMELEGGLWRTVATVRNGEDCSLEAPQWAAIFSAKRGTASVWEQRLEGQDIGAEQTLDLEALSDVAEAEGEGLSFSAVLIDSRGSEEVADTLALSP